MNEIDAMEKVNTTRFGPIVVQQVLHFKDGLLGFPDAKRFMMLEPGEDAVFFWLQSLDDPALAFVVTNPEWFLAGYRATFTDARKLALVIVNKNETDITANAMGPLMIDTETMQGEQIILRDGRWTTREPIIGLAALAALGLNKDA